MATKREVKEGQQFQGVDESIVYRIDTSGFGGTPSSPVVTVYELRGDNKHDVTSVVMSTNSPSINGDYVVLSHLNTLTANRTYRVEVKFTSGGNVLECWFEVVGEE